MAVTEIPWGDGSGDKIYLTYSEADGDQTVLVSSDANGGAARQKVITFVSTVGNISRSLTVLQESGMDYVSITWNDVCITYNDTAIAYPYEEQYIVFVDSEVEQICVSNWGDGTGIKPSQAAQVTTAQFGTTFQGNTEITSFDELQYFTGLTQLPVNAFNGCTSLSALTLPDSIGQLYGNSLQNLSVGATLNLGDGSPFLRSGNAPSLHRITTVICKDLLQYINLYSGSTGASYGCIFGQAAGGARLFDSAGNEITSCVIPSTITEIKANTFAYNKSFTDVTIPASVTSIGAWAFSNVGTSSEKVTYIVLATTPPTLANPAAGIGVFTNNNIDTIYVPNGTLSAYQTATNWSSYASYMAELDANGNIPT